MQETILSIIGALILFYGRDMDWLFVTGIGLLAGLRFAPVFLPESTPAWLILVIAAGPAILCFLILNRDRNTGLAVSGFLAGGIFALDYLGLHSAPAWASFLAGGIAGLIGLIALKDWLLILLSSALGAVLVMQAFNMPVFLRAIISIGLFVVGSLVQALMFTRDRRANLA
jgi:hypothetical protein